jgi:2-dehydropantoate 2-reductase
MNVVVVGAGAIGGYFGGRLQEAGLKVTFLVRENRADQLRRTGLVIQSPAGNVHLVPQIALSANQVETCDLVLLAVKNYHLQPVLESIRPLIERGGKVLPLLNGVEHFDILERTFGKNSILGGLCQIIVTLDSEGRIIHTSKMHDLIFGALEHEQQTFCENLAEKTQGAKMPVTLSKNIRVDIWSKYSFITAFSGITTASRLPINEILKVDATKEIYRQLLAEMQTLAAAKGIQLADLFVEKMIDRAHQLPDGSTSSMHQDFRKGLPLEVESLQGAAARLGKQTGLELPTISTIYGLIKPYENGNIQ